MYLLVRGSALEIQDKLAGNLPVEANDYVTKEVWVAEDPSVQPHKEQKKVPVVVRKKIDSVETIYSFVKLADDVFVMNLSAEVSDWVDDEGSSSDSTDAEP